MHVSQATLDAALARLETRHVLVRRQGSGVYVSSRLRQHNIVLLCNPEHFIVSGASPFWGLLVEQIRQTAARSEAALSLQFLRPPMGAEPQNAPDYLPDTLRTQVNECMVHGVICVGAPHAVAQFFEAGGVPVVAYAGAANSIIAHADATAMEQGVAELHRQGLPCHLAVASGAICHGYCHAAVFGIP